MRHLALLAAAALAAAPGPAHAQQITLPITVLQDANGTQFLPAGTLQNLRIPRGLDAVLMLHCPDATHCAGLEAHLLAGNAISPLTVVQGTPAERKQITVEAVEIPAAAQSIRVRLKLGTATRELNFPIADDATPRSAMGITCDQRLTLQGSFYDEENDQAQFVVSPYGTVLARPDRPIDENDNVIVYLVGTSAEVERVRIKRSSLARVGGTILIQAADTLKPSANLVGSGGLVEDCEVVRADLGDFAAGRGEIEITRAGTNAAAPDFQMGKFDLTVNPLYAGAFSLGPVVTWNDDRTYATLADGTVTETSAGAETHYVVAYTHFMRRRDTEKTDRLHIDPVVAVQPNELLKHVFAGVSADLFHGSVFLIAGVHGAEVTRLDPRSGVTVGGKLPSGFTSVPTRDEWGWGGFGGMTIDLRAALGLVRRAADAMLRGP